MPLVRPGLTTLAILTFLGSWNSYIWPLMVLRGNEVITLPVGIATMRSQATASAIPYGEMMAAATLVSRAGDPALHHAAAALHFWLDHWRGQGLIGSGDSAEAAGIFQRLGESLIHLTSG